MTDRLHRFDALDNFRDYGDYASAAGRRIAGGRLFRSAHHARASEADLERLAGLNLAGQVIESTHDDGGEAPHITFLKTADLTIDAGRRFMTDTYRELAFDPAHIDLFSRYFRAVGEADGPVLIHCAAGKDRTGLLAALTHHLLGVHRDDMVEDYLLTNAAVDLAGRAPGIARQLETMTGRPVAHDAVVAFLGVEPVYLETAMGEIAARHGSVESYLEEALGVDATLRDRIGERLTA